MLCDEANDATEQHDRADRLELPDSRERFCTGRSAWTLGLSLGEPRISWDHSEVEKRFQYQFEWDPVKAQRNLKDHGIAFERAATVFLDPEALSEFDEEHSQDEDRWITLGLDRTGTLLVVCHTYREETEVSARIRLISARQATKNEAKQYARK